MKIKFVACFVSISFYGLCIGSSAGEPWYPRPSSEIVKEKLLPQILLERSLRAEKRSTNHSGKKCGVFLIKDNEKLVLPRI